MDKQKYKSFLRNFVIKLLSLLLMKLTIVDAKNYTATPPNTIYSYNIICRKIMR